MPRPAPQFCVSGAGFVKIGFAVRGRTPLQSAGENRLQFVMLSNHSGPPEGSSVLLSMREWRAIVPDFTEKTALIHWWPTFTTNLLVQPCPGEGPVAICRTPGNSQRFGRLIECQAGEIPQFDKLGCLQVQRIETSQGFVQGEQILSG